jgi:hypothetical protein
MTTTRERVDQVAAERLPNLRRPKPISAAEVIAVTVAGVLLAVAMTWPMLLRLRGHVPLEPNDPMLMSWVVAWTGHALVHQPLDIFQANTFYPEANSLAFGDGVVGYAPLGAIGKSPDAALVRFNLLVLFTYALAFVGAYLLTRELGVGWIPAAIAGIAFSFSPWRLAHINHLNVLSGAGVALALFFLVRGYRRRRTVEIVVGWLFACWQLSLGFSTGLQFAYLMGILSLAVGLGWLWRGRPSVKRSLVVATALGVMAFGGTGLLLAQPYFQIEKEHAAELRERLKQVDLYSPPPRGFLAAPAESLVWGRATSSVRDSLFWPQEQGLFPGLTVVVLAAIGMGSSVYSRGLRVGLAAGMTVAGMFAMGTALAGGRFTYQFLQRFPGWGAVRTPGRLMFLISLALAVLAAGGLEFLLHRIQSKGHRQLTARGWIANWGLAAILLGAVMLEGRGQVPHVEVPAAPAGQAGAPSPQVHLPIGVPDPRYQFWSVEGFPKMPNGWATFYPSWIPKFQQDLVDFPSEKSIRALRDLGIRVVIFHPDLAGGTPWQSLRRRPLEGLPVTERVSGDVVLYYLN